MVSCFICVSRPPCGSGPSLTLPSRSAIDLRPLRGARSSWARDACLRLWCAANVPTASAAREPDGYRVGSDRFVRWRRRAEPHQGYRRGAGPSGTKRRRRARFRAKALSSASITGESRTARRTRPSGRVRRISARSITPPPRSPSTAVPSRSMSHQHSPRLSSGTEASKGPASSSPSGSSASSWWRSNLATTRADQRQNRQPPEKSKTGRGR